MRGGLSPSFILEIVCDITTMEAPIDPNVEKHKRWVGSSEGVEGANLYHGCTARTDARDFDDSASRAHDDADISLKSKTSLRLMCRKAALWDSLSRIKAAYGGLDSLSQITLLCE
jgi:hypothetical protein